MHPFRKNLIRPAPAVVLTNPHSPLTQEGGGTFWLEYESPDIPPEVQERMGIQGRANLSVQSAETSEGAEYIKATEAQKPPRSLIVSHRSSPSPLSREHFPMLTGEYSGPQGNPYLAARRAGLAPNLLKELGARLKQLVIQKAPPPPPPEGQGYRPIESFGQEAAANAATQPEPVIEIRRGRPVRVE